MYTAAASDRRNLMLVVMSRQPERVFTVAELAGFAVGDEAAPTRRPSQLVSDALRMPVKRGWVIRIGRGRYRYAGMPSTSRRRAQRWVQARQRGLDPAERSAHSNWRTTTESGRPVPPLSQ